MIQKLTPENHKPYDRPNDSVTKVLVQSEGTGDGIYVDQNSLRFNRKKFTIAVTGFVVGAVVILLQSPFRNQLITPGPLNSTHAQIIASQSGDQCAACHDVGSQNFGQWLSAMFRPGKKVQACQSQLCMECHSQSLNEQYASKPHNMPPEKLRQITAKHEKNYVSFKAGFDPPIDELGNIECSSCHREHHGQSDLMAITDQQCQSCHAVEYDSFESSHPEFAGWPQQRRQRIAFDHTSHGFKHFPGKNEKFQCSMCHVDDRFQSVKLLASYEQTCAKCHQKDIDGRSQSGVQLLAMPMMDLDAISDEKKSIGFWPEDASGDFDGRLPELMRLLMFKDEPARKILQKLGPDFEFGDLDPSDSGDVGDAVQLAWSIKYLIYDLAIGGAGELRSRLEFAFQRSISENEFEVLTCGLDERVFASTANKWLPGLAQEVPDHRARIVNASGVASLGANEPFRYFKDDEPGLLRKNPLAELMSPKSVATDDAGNFEQVDDGSQPQIEAVRELSVASSTESQAHNEPVSKPANESAIAQGTNWLTNEVETPTVPGNTHQLNNQANVASKPLAANNEATPQIPEDELLAGNPLSNALDQSSSSSSSSSSDTHAAAVDPALRPPSVTVQQAPISNAESKVQAAIASGSVNGPPNGSSDNPAKTHSSPVLSLNQGADSDIDDSELLASNPLRLNAPDELPADDSTLLPSANDSTPNGATAGDEPSQQAKSQAQLPQQEQQQLTQEFVEQLVESKQNPSEQERIHQPEAQLENQFSVETENGEQFVSSSLKSGWFRNDGLYRISYRPAGHADKFLSTMMDVVGKTQDLKNNPAAMPYFKKMISESSVGACNNCHTIDSVDETYSVNWKAQYRDPMLRSFTRFSHGPHLTQVQLKDCTSCHAMESNHANAYTFKHFDPTDTVSNFAPIKKSNCTSCHFKGSADSSCMQCHNYHIGSRVLLNE